MSDLRRQPTLESLVADLQGRLGRLERQSTPEALIYVGITAGAPAFQNSWVNFDGNNPPTHRCAHFYRDRGRVYLGGVIKTGANGTTAFVLPAGYRPIAQTDDGSDIPVTANLGVAHITIKVAGNVVPVNIGSTSVSTFVFLDGVSFRHA